MKTLKVTWKKISRTSVINSVTFYVEIEAQEEEQDGDMEEDEESMSLKDVIMTLNDFYSFKLEALLKLMEKWEKPNSKSTLETEIEKIEQIVKDNEVRIPYDEEIFIGIDKNYKILKKILGRIKGRIPLNF